MPHMSINLDGDNAWPDLKSKRPDQIIHLKETIALAVLDGGMQSGKPSVCFRIDLPDGRVILAETSAALFCSAARAIEARFPGFLG